VPPRATGHGKLPLNIPMLQYTLYAPPMGPRLIVLLQLQRITSKPLFQTCGLCHSHPTTLTASLHEACTHSCTCKRFQDTEDKTSGISASKNAHAFSSQAVISNSPSWTLNSSMQVAEVKLSLPNSDPISDPVATTFTQPSHGCPIFASLALVIHAVPGSSCL